MANEFKYEVGQMVFSKPYFKDGRVKERWISNINGRQYYQIAFQKDGDFDIYSVHSDHELLTLEEKWEYM